MTTWIGKKYGNKHTWLVGIVGGKKTSKRIMMIANYLIKYIAKKNLNIRLYDKLTRNLKKIQKAHDDR